MVTKGKSRTPVLDQYSDIRARFKTLASGVASPGTQITDHHGFYIGGGHLTERFAGLDKLFYTLVHGIVDDPDFAVRKDPKVYDKMMRDPQIFYCLAVRKAAVSSLPWVIRPPVDLERDPTAIGLAKAAEKRLKRIPRFSELLDNIVDALLPGLSVNELVWEVTKEGSYIVKSHHPVNKDRVKFDKDGRLRLLAPRAPTWGLQVPPYKFIRHTFNTTGVSWKAPQEAGYEYYGRGLADTPLYHYFYFKMMALKFLMKTLERYGMPFKIFYTGPQNKTLADKMSEIMTALANDSVVGIPGKKGDVMVDVITKGQQAGKGNVFTFFINYIDSLITKAILGQELMTEMPGVGSYAAAQVHRSVFTMLNDRDRTLLKDTLDRTLLRYDAQLNTPNLKEELYPMFDFKKMAIEDAANFLTTVTSAVKLGIPVSVTQVREYTGLRAPLEGEEVVTPPPPEAEPEPEPGQANAKANGKTKPKEKNKTAKGTRPGVS